MTADLFDASAMYGDDYLHFFAGEVIRVTHGPGVPTGHDGVALAERLLGIEPGMAVLDVGCGPGAMARALAARGCRVTGLDFSTVFLDRGRADAAEQGVDVDFVEGDMRALPGEWTGRFDRVVNWSTAFGYFDDVTNRAVLAEMVRVLKPGGRLAIELDNQVRFLADWTPSRVTVVKENGDMVVDRHQLDALTGRFEVERTIIRDGNVRKLTFLKRLFGFPELRDWLAAAGLGAITGHGEDGEPLTAEHSRMIVTAVAVPNN